MQPRYVIPRFHTDCADDVEPHMYLEASLKRSSCSNEIVVHTESQFFMESPASAFFRLFKELTQRRECAACGVESAIPDSCIERFTDSVFAAMHDTAAKIAASEGEEMPAISLEQKTIEGH